MTKCNMTNSREKRRLLRRKKRIGFLFLLLLLIGVVSYQFLIPHTIEPCTPNKFTIIIVDEGDSLWKIAERFNNNKMDIRNYINLIQQHNALNNDFLQPGDIIKVPLI